MSVGIEWIKILSKKGLCVIFKRKNMEYIPEDMDFAEIRGLNRKLYVHSNIQCMIGRLPENLTILKLTA